MAHSFDTLGEDDVLTKIGFHKLLLAFYTPVRWPGWLIAAVAVALAAVPGALWWLLSRDAGLAGVVVAILLAFIAVDAYILELLPRRRISFGPWKGQISPLALLRVVAALLLGILGLVLGWPTALLLTVAAQFVGTAALYRAALVEPRRLALSHLRVSSDRLPPGAQPIRILHISDIHLERLGEREARLLELAREAKPDLILLTGDYVNLSNNLDETTHQAVRRLLGHLSAHYGIYAVPGSPPVDLHAVIPVLFAGLPVSLLRNEAVEVTLSRNRRLTLIGLDCHHDIERDAAVLARVAAGAPGNGPRVLLYHSPELFHQAVGQGIDLYLCGHTHGGQVRLPIIGPLLTMSKLGRRYAMGHHQESRTHLYVTRGIGFEGLSAPRVRLFCPPEMTLVELGANNQ